MLSESALAWIDDERLVSAARAELNPLVSTPLEIELLGRMERLLEELAENKPYADLYHEHSVTPEDMQALINANPAEPLAMAEMLALLSDHDIHTPGALKALLANPT